VFDADALVATGAPGPGPRVFTPHPGEAARLLGRSVPEVEADRLAAAASLATRGVALLKGPHTVISDGGVPSLNPTGNPVLATGGTGDVLSGVVGALLARGVGALTAARLGAWVHGAAGDHLARTRSQGWLASDGATAVPGALEEVLR
jgi:NAD(P)H-hydrate epimerase